MISKRRGNVDGNLLTFPLYAMIFNIKKIMENNSKINWKLPDIYVRIYKKPIVIFAVAKF